MPTAAPTACLHGSGCTEIAIPGTGRCARHQKVRAKGNSAARGYDFRWQVYRLWFLRHHPVCLGPGPLPADWLAEEPALRQRCGHAATDVHHIRKIEYFPELRLVEANCLPQCHSCHSIRSKRGE